MNKIKINEEKETMNKHQTKTQNTPQTQTHNKCQVGESDITMETSHSNVTVGVGWLAFCFFGFVSGVLVLGYFSFSVQKQ